jgi:hypothetical protein
MKHIFFLLALTLYASAAFAQTGEKAASYKGGEMLEYIVSYRAAMWPNTDMATVTMEVADDTVDSAPAFKLTAYARVKGMFRWFYKLDDYYISWLSKKDLKAIKATSELTEGSSYRYSGSFAYDWENMTILSRYRNHRNPLPTTKKMTLPEGAMDAVSLLYNLRGKDIASYNTGEINDLNLVLDDTIRVIKYKFHGREPIEVSGLGKVNTLKFSCSMVTSDAQSFQEGSEFFVWISDDPNKVPVYIELPLKVGSARVRLSKYENLKYPRESVINNK